MQKLLRNILQKYNGTQNDNLDHSKENKFLIEGESTMQDDLFSMQELDVVINAQKNNKAPGPDGCGAELVKWLDETNRLSLLKFYNHIITSEQYPDSFKHANIAAIYKKGDATRMQNYRPIALLQVFYKLLAGLLRGWFIAAYDHWIAQTQYGFRPGKSTAQAIFLARRL